MPGYKEKYSSSVNSGSESSSVYEMEPLTNSPKRFGSYSRQFISTEEPSDKRGSFFPAFRSKGYRRLEMLPNSNPVTTSVASNTQANISKLHNNGISSNDNGGFSYAYPKASAPAPPLKNPKPSCDESAPLPTYLHTSSSNNTGISGVPTPVLFSASMILASLSIGMCLLSMFYSLIKIAGVLQFTKFSLPPVRDTHKIAFGSGLMMESEAFSWLPIAKIKPDVWIWAGNFVSLRNSQSLCQSPSGKKDEASFDCLCDMLMTPDDYSGCKTPNIEEVVGRFRMQLLQENYQEFLKGMCAADGSSGSPSSSGVLCSNYVLGVYGKQDLHPSRQNYIGKNIFLDAIGEPYDSSRRSSLQGLEKVYHFNKGNSAKEISVFLMDDRYYSDPISCTAMRDACDSLTGDQAVDDVWLYEYCKKISPPSYCCLRDEFFFGKEGWCKRNASDRNIMEGEHISYQELCEPDSVKFGSKRLSLNLEAGSVSSVGPKLATSFCEIFGLTQRLWLMRELSESKARVNLIVTSFPLLQSKGDCNSTSDILHEPLKCHTVAQRQILAQLSRSRASCIILLSGSQKWSGINVLQPQKDQKSHSSWNPGMTRPIYQMASSGSARPSSMGEMNGKNDIPNGGKDKINNSTDCLAGGLNNCQRTTLATFGVISADWDSYQLHLKLYYTSDGSIASEATVNLADCS